MGNSTSSVIRPYQLFMLALCVLVLVSLAVEVLIPLDDETRLILFYADTVVCILFLGDFAHSLATAPQRSRYFFTWGWIDLLSSIPAAGFLRAGRAARVARILRLLRGARSTRDLGAFVIAKRAQSTLLAVLLATLLVVVASSIAILQVERPAGGNIATASGALWWSVVTVATVGYGDRFPITFEGRTIAVLLMGTGIALFGVFTAYVASWFMEPDERAQDQEFRAIHEELAELRRLLSTE